MDTTSLTPTQQEVKRLYLLKIQNKSIATITGLTIGQVNRIIYKVLGLQSKNKGLKGDEIKAATKLRQKGLKIREIQDHLGITRDRVNRLLRA